MQAQQGPGGPRTSGLLVSNSGDVPRTGHTSLSSHAPVTAAVTPVAGSQLPAVAAPLRQSGGGVSGSGVAANRPPSAARHSTTADAGRYAPVPDARHSGVAAGRNSSTASVGSFDSVAAFAGLTGGSTVAGAVQPRGRVTLSGIPRASVTGAVMGDVGAGGSGVAGSGRAVGHGMASFSAADVGAAVGGVVVHFGGGAVSAVGGMGVGGAGGLYGVPGQGDGLPSVPSLLNLGSAFKSSTAADAQAEAELCWQWLENLMISMQETEAIRLEVADEAQEVAKQGVFGGDGVKGEEGDEDTPVTRILPASNPHKADPMQQERISTIDKIMESTVSACSLSFPCLAYTSPQHVMIMKC